MVLRHLIKASVFNDIIVISAPLGSAKGIFAERSIEEIFQLKCDSVSYDTQKS
jgi:hypothetical protein